MNYRDFQPEKTSRVREAIEWSVTYSFNATDTKTPRVLLIGDSICNGYQPKVREKLADRANVTFWASSKCVTDPDYFRELDFILDSGRFDFISFNNGLHSLVTDITEWDAAYSSAVRFILAKKPDAKLLLTLSTSLNDPAKTSRSKALNEIVKRVAAENRLEIIDLFTPTDSLDKDAEMADVYHFKAPAIDTQAAIIAETVDRVLGLSHGNNVQKSTETGASGRQD